MLGKIKFTVVLSIFNVEKYLIRCLDSVINQTYNNLEIILVDDGSTDSCPLICDCFAKLDHRIKVIHKNNSGLGMARNTGLENATGDYICFIDSDDFVSNKLFEICNKKLEEERFDIFDFDFAKFSDGKYIYDKYKRNKNTIYRGGQIVDYYFRNMIYNRENKLRIHACAWNKIYSIKFLKSINFKFVSERVYISEDYFSNLFIYKYAKSVCCVTDALYFYCNNSQSLTHTYNEKRFEKTIFQYLESKKICSSLQYGEKIKNSISCQSFISTLMAFHSLFLQSDIDIDTKKSIIYNHIMSENYKILWNDLKYKDFKLPIKFFIRTLKHGFVDASYIIIKAKYSR